VYRLSLLSDSARTVIFQKIGRRLPALYKDKKEQKIDTGQVTSRDGRFM
jgi:hypothetical protein